MDTSKRGLTIHFFEGSRIHIEFPVQTPNEIAAEMKLEDILKQRQIIAEVDGTLLIIPFENIKYIQAHPVPPKLPRHVIQGASVHD
jgi:hypothetical protein